MKLEICTGSIIDIENIKDLKIDRIELNSAIELGGLTPSLATLKKAKQLSEIPVMCMVRCRSGNFIYSDLEKEIMYQEASDLIQNGADGLVFGSLTKDLEVDIAAVKKIREIAKDKTLVFHKAFDEIVDQEKAIQTLIDLKVDRILLMGNKNFADNIANIRYLNDKYGDKIELLPGGGVNETNINNIINETKVNNIHGTFKTSQDGHIINDREYIKRIIKLIKGI